MQTILYLYCTDPATLCICYLRRNLSVFDRAGPFFLCKFLFTWPFLPDVVRFLSPGFWVVVQGRVLTEDGGTMEWRHGSEMERKKERGDSIAEWRIEAALLEARHRLRLTSLSLTDWWDYPDIFSFQLKLHYHKDLMLGRSPYYSQGIWVPFCSLLHSVLRFFTHTQRDEIFFQTCMYYPFARLHGSISETVQYIFAAVYHGNAVSPAPAPPTVNQNDAGHSGCKWTTTFD